MNYFGRYCRLCRCIAVSLVVNTLSACGGGGSTQIVAGPTEPGLTAAAIGVDASWGMQGQALFPLTNAADGLGPSTLQPDGKLVITGWRETVLQGASSRPPREAYVVRLNNDGARDSTFGTGGEIRFNVLGSDRVASIRIQSDGKILLAVYASQPCSVTFLSSPCLKPDGTVATTSTAMVRLTATGTVDTTFGSAGIVQTTFFGGPLDMAQQADGKTLLLQSTSNPRFSIYGWTLSRFNANGAPDASFNAGNPVISRCASDGNALLIQADGGILVGGAMDVGYANPTDHPGLCLERIRSDGSQDLNFRASALWTSFGINFALRSLVQLQGGDLLAVGRGSDSGTYGIAAARFDSQGVLKQSFGTRGILNLMVSFPFYLNDFVISPAGRIVAVGNSDYVGDPVSSQGYQKKWVGVDENGQPLNTFGQNGIVLGDLDWKVPSSLLQDSSGRWIVVSGVNVQVDKATIVVNRLKGFSP